MANRIKGISVEIGGDTTKLQTAFKGVNSEVKNTLDPAQGCGYPFFNPEGSLLKNMIDFYKKRITENTAGIGSFFAYFKNRIGEKVNVIAVREACSL